MLCSRLLLWFALCPYLWGASCLGETLSALHWQSHAHQIITIIQPTGSMAVLHHAADTHTQLREQLPITDAHGHIHVQASWRDARPHAHEFVDEHGDHPILLECKALSNTGFLKDFSAGSLLNGLPVTRWPVLLTGSLPDSSGFQPSPVSRNSLRALVRCQRLLI